MKSNEILKPKVMNERAKKILEGLKQFNGSVTIF